MLSVRPSALRALVVIAPLLTALALPCSSLAQTTSASISGTVVDPEGKTVPGATVTIIDERTNETRVTVSDAERGTFQITCDGCKKDLYTEAACSRCGAEGGVGRALENENAFPLPTACLRCGSELLTATAFVPATVVYEGKRGAKARTQTAPEDPGFHAFRVECKECKTADERRSPCPLCA